ncbi:MAG TPA: division/cell wall cluster transcriptional repressor MraZ [Chloroflexota bacterium]|nr:division/cell wall cluster transcriptional repressor MraZ [Chloroflexota bacterium]
MFLGEFTHSVDSKGRLAIPAKFRLRLGEGAVVTRGLDGCLVIYPAEEWREFAEKLDKLPSTQPDVRNYKRFIFSGATECDFDRQGRVLIPAFLREYASLGETAAVIGQYSKVEIWSQSRWEERRPQEETDGEQIAERLSGLGLDI